MVYRAGDGRRTEAVVDIHDRDTAGATVEHRQQRRDPPEAGAVTDAGGNRNDGDVDEPADDAWQGALHPSDHDDDMGGREPRVFGQQTVKP